MRLYFIALTSVSIGYDNIVLVSIRLRSGNTGTSLKRSHIRHSLQTSLLVGLLQELTFFCGEVDHHVQHLSCHGEPVSEQLLTHMQQLQSKMIIHLDSCLCHQVNVHYFLSLLALFLVSTDKHWAETIKLRITSSTFHISFSAILLI